MSPSALNPRTVLEALQSLRESVPTEPIDTESLRASERRKLRKEIEHSIQVLQRLLIQLDPIRLPPHVLDPSDPAQVGKLIAETLLVQDRHSLESTPKFHGSGVYAIYYWEIRRLQGHCWN